MFQWCFDEGHRRAQFMRNVGEKPGLQLIQLFQFFSLLFDEFFVLSDLPGAKLYFAFEPLGLLLFIACPEQPKDNKRKG